MKATFIYVILACFAAWFTASLTAADLQIRSRNDFKQMPTFFNLIPSGDGMRIEYNGKSPHSRDLFLKENYPLSGQKFIRLTVEYTKNIWNYSARFIPVLHFVDSNGKTVARYDIDFGYLCAADFSTNWKLGERTYFHNDFRVPKNAVRLEIAFNCRGNALAFTLHRVSIADDGKDQTKAFFKRPNYKHSTPSLSRNEVVDILSKRPALTVKTIRKNDRIILSVNRQEMEPLIFKNGPVEGSAPEQLKRSATFRKTGFKIFVVNVPFGQSRGRVRGPVWTGDRQYDISQLENAVYDVISHVPDAYVMLELHINPYYEWCLANPDEIYCNPAGVKGLFTSRFVKFSNTPPRKNDILIWQPSLHSEKFRKDTVAALEEVFRRFAKTPAAKALVGVYLNGGIDNQWFAPSHDSIDHSRASVNGFKKFVRERYKGDLNALRKAWGSTDVTFDTVQLPTSEEIRFPDFTYDNAKVPDFNQFLKETGTNLFRSFAAAVKRGSDERFLVGAYWPHGGLSSYPMSEHSNMEDLITAKEIDFYAVVPDYYIAREPGQARSAAAYNGSLKLHNKLLVTELDIRTAEIRNWGMWGGDYHMETHNAESFHQNLLSYIAWCRASGGGFHAYDLTCGFWDTDKAVRAWEDGMRLALSTRNGRPKMNPVAVFTEERTKFFYTQHPSYNTFQYGLREDPVQALRLAGLPYDLYLPGDVFSPELKDTKLLIFADAGYMTAAAADKVRRVYGNSGRVIVWNYLPGIFTADSPATVTKFRIVPCTEADRKPLSVLKTEDPVTEGLEGFNTNMSTLRPGIQYAVKDPEAKTLAVYRDTDKGAMAVKRYPSHTEVWIGQAGAFTPQLYRNLARMANITPVIETDEPVYIGNGFLAMQASFTGSKVIALPDTFRDFNVYTGQKAEGRSGNKVTFNLKAGETLVLLER